MQKQNPLNRFDVILITGKTVSLSRQEVTRVFLHPWILSTYSALSLMTVAMNQQPWTLGMPLWLRTAIYFLSSVVGLSTAWLTLIALSWAVTSRLVRRVHSIIFDLSGAFMSLFTTYCLAGTYGQRPNLLSIASAFLYVFYIVIIVHVSIFLWSVVIPRILRQLRLQDEFSSLMPQHGSIEPDKTAREAVAEEYCASADNISNQSDIVVVGARRIPAHTILHIRAEGNYVRIYTSKTIFFEGATMKVVLSQIPAHLGLRTHRSHWIAYSAIETVINDGRGLTVSLVSGVQIPVSRSNMNKVKSLVFRDLRA